MKRVKSENKIVFGTNTEKCMQKRALVYYKSFDLNESERRQNMKDKKATTRAKKLCKAQSHRWDAAPASN